jgi:single-strand DNA-binding protein
MQMLGSREGMGGGETGESPAPRASAPARAPAARQPAANIADMDDDIPF